MNREIQAPYYPIIYVRGYAGSQGEVEDTVADPYMGFNIGSIKIRQLWDGRCQRYFFESPLVRLMKDYEYRDVYDSGDVMPADADIQPRSIFIHRYYERTSAELGDGQRLSIEQAAFELGKLIGTIRERLCGQDAKLIADFRVYLVAHSMGGLVCRCLLQNAALSGEDGTLMDPSLRKTVDKVFTYATPHNGIDLDLIGNVPGMFTRNDADNFNRKRMSAYLALPANSDDVDSLNGQFDPDRIFCLVGTNDKDYDVAGGLVRKAVGPMSDGLVRIVNATTRGPVPGKAGEERNSPRAFVHRSHSGHYGIVNSEEGFQNLTRFLFGDVRVDAVLQIKQLTLPAKVEEARKAGKQIRASYNFEVVVRVRGKMWDLHRRTSSENSAIFRKFDDLFPKDGTEPRHPQLFSVFLSRGARVNPKRPGLGFSVDLSVLVPQYEVDRVLWFDDHYEGGYLFRDKINFEAMPPSGDEQTWDLKYGFDSSTPNRTTRSATSQEADNETQFLVPIVQNTRPGIEATLVLRATPWK